MIAASIITPPAIRVSHSIASERSLASTPESVEPAARAAALVVVITMSRVLEVSPPAIGPANEA